MFFDSIAVRRIYPLRCSLFLVFLALIIVVCGCSGESHAPVTLPVFPIPTTLSLQGNINLSNVAVHSSLGGVIPSIRTRNSASLLDHSGFKVAAEDDPSISGNVDSVGAFALSPISLRDQLVLRLSDSKHPGFVLEWMGYSPTGLRGSKTVLVTVPSTARSFIARSLRNNYGKRIDPETITDSQINDTAQGIYQVLEKNPEKLSENTPLDKVPEIEQAVTSQAAALNASSSAIFSRDWTILIYQGGDNSLELSLIGDFKEIKNSVIPRNVAVGIQIDTTRGGIKRYLFENGAETELADIGPGNSADPLVLADFAAWGMRALPAKHIAFIAGSHGLGWRGKVENRGFIVDDSSNSLMDLVALKGALKAATTHFGKPRPFDIIGFDACLMGMLEIAWQLRETANFIIFSQANEPAQGWPYELIFQKLGSDPAKIDPENFGKGICEAYKAFYSTGSNSRYSGTLSLIKTEKLPPLIDAFKLWAEELFKNRETLKSVLGGLRDALYQGREELAGPEKYRVQSFEMVDYRDLKDLVESGKSSAAQANIQADKLLSVFPDAVLFKTRFGEKYFRANGLSLAFPSPSNFADYQKNPLTTGYRSLDLSRDTQWEDLLFFLNEASATPLVDGRNLTITLDWDGLSDLDLYIGEPDPSVPGKVVWYSAADGAPTSNGEFSRDSLTSGDSEETWHAKQLILPGDYWLVANYFSKSANQDPAKTRMKASFSGTNQVFEKPDLKPGNQFQPAKIIASKEAVSIEEIPVPDIPGAVLKSLEKSLVAKKTK